ncbi:MAG: hypothetical protein HYX42_10595 [Polaromonas sp.]|uniref:hypothetical protein n=1 Tax=Polaromonas sp. TaxID=1869339 RepID=UPI0025CD3A07|nr:hypothetical protein [Polaromonas sp.]MBI2726684.1 hypothetical protein [Polaromonas sp.]
MNSFKTLEFIKLFAIKMIFFKASFPLGMPAYACGIGASHHFRFLLWSFLPPAAGIDGHGVCTVLGTKPACGGA